MGSFRTSGTYAPVPNALVEVAPNCIVGTFEVAFDAGPQAAVYIRPGNINQQDYAVADGAEWLLYTRSVLSYRIECYSVLGAVGGASLIVDIGDLATAAPVMRDWMPFHLIPDFFSENSGIELPGLLARFRIQTASADGLQIVQGSIIIRGM